MDFIERWLGLQPDAGSGMSEVVVLATLLATLALVAYRRRQKI